MLLTIYTALPAYSTPINMVSAAFACIIDDTRTEVLEALIDLDRSGVMEHTMLESRFTYLAAYPEAEEPDPDVPENTNDLELRTASIYTGNFEAFRLLSFNYRPNDGTLNLAAHFALPNLIKWLLANGHDSNHRDANTNMLTPLAILCSSTYMPCCTVANGEVAFPARQKQSMRILAAQTDPA